MDATLTSAVADPSRDEKLLLLDSLWASLADAVDKAPVPESHLRELERREARIADRTASYGDWEEVRERIF